VRQLRCGDPLSADTDVGPVSNAPHADKIAHYLRLAVEEGGKIECGGDRPAGTAEGRLAGGYFINPAVVTGLPYTSRVAQEEVFGPVATLHAFDTEDEVVEAVNSNRYGLAGSIWTENLSRGHRVAHRIHSGILWVNCWLHRDLRTPFGGVKDSGVGREGGRFSLDFYSEWKNVCVAVPTGV
jgi:aminomuconate-semialdehyde/2-hydroxymuconate-6-semialdehyde dehydrogenase